MTLGVFDVSIHTSMPPRPSARANQMPLAMYASCVLDARGADVADELLNSSTFSSHRAN